MCAVSTQPDLWCNREYGWNNWPHLVYGHVAHTQAPAVLQPKLHSSRSYVQIYGLHCEDDVDRKAWIDDGSAHSERIAPRADAWVIEDDLREKHRLSET